MLQHCVTYIREMALCDVINVQAAFSRGQRACKPTRSRWAEPSMDTRNPKRSHKYVASLLGRNRISDGEGSGLTEEELKRWRGGWAIIILTL
ncbi:hypothetical protein EVAR_5066_1 [Eumeta japonica]|uniref:Uncharacterized protein n=1 Tax=Eumeta variegata TaxID=151549 RepID=A0A4C1SUA8_EUMVA|nr:hypothetical protein EVAR_5066_1 [Eumeta japonica]